MIIHDPIHPGKFLKDVYLKPLDITTTGLAKRLGVSTASLSRVINGKSDLSYEMAVRLSKFFDRTPKGWMNLQVDYSLYHAERNVIESIEKYDRFKGV